MRRTLVFVLVAVLMVSLAGIVSADDPKGDYSEGCTTSWCILGANYSTGYGVYGYSARGTGLFGYGDAAGGNSSIGVWGQTPAVDGAGVVGRAYGNLGWGVEAYGATIGVYSYGGGWGVYGQSPYYAIYGYDNGNSGGYGGFFSGRVYASKGFTSPVAKVEIDHPKDPSNQILRHAYVDSAEMLSVYNGNVVTNDKGEAVVKLPDYVEALNTDFRYQLTVVGQFAQAIIGSKVKDNRFTIKTDKPNVEVSWQVSGVRKDAYAQANPLVVEEAKAADQKGLYLNPEAFGQPASKGVESSHLTFKDKQDKRSENGKGINR